jgi:zinc/manganese transport system permease protein
MFEFLIPNNMICHATEAMLFTSVGCAILAVLITQMKISSIGFTTAHGAFAGASVGMFFGVDMTISAIIGSFFLACVLGPLSEKSRMPIDTTLGVLFGSMMAIAIFFYVWMQQLGIGLGATSLLFGSVLSLYREEIYGLLAITIIVILFVVVFYKEISAMIFNRKIAEITGIRTKPVMYSVLFMITLMIAFTLPIVGGLLLYVWLVAPAAIAYQFCGTLKQMLITSPVIAAVISLCGTFVSFIYNLPVTSFSAMLFTMVFVASVLVSSRRQVNNREK